jgi:hypothetical protein
MRVAFLGEIAKFELRLNERRRIFKNKSAIVVSLNKHLLNKYLIVPEEIVPLSKTTISQIRNLLGVTTSRNEIGKHRIQLFFNLFNILDILADNSLDHYQARRGYLLMNLHDSVFGREDGLHARWNDEGRTAVLLKMSFVFTITNVQHIA